MPDRYQHQATPWRDAATLHELYVEKLLSTTEIGERLGCSDVTVGNWLERHGIERRDRVEGMTRVKRKEPASFETNFFGYEAWRCQVGEERYSVFVHRLVAVAEHGFDAVAGRHVHHKNEIPWDNRPENLAVLEPADHFRHHLEDREWDDDGNLI